MRRLRSLAVGLAVAALAGAGAVLAGCGDALSAQQAVQAECAADKNACVEVGVGRPIYLGTLLFEEDSAGLDSKRAVELAVDYLDGAFDSRQGELLGHPVSLLAESEDCTPKGGVAGARRLLLEPDLVAVIGTTCSAAAFDAAAKVLSAKDVLLMSPSNTSPLLTDPKTHERFYFRTAFNDLIQGAAVAAFVKEKLGATTAGVISVPDAYSKTLGEAFADRFWRDGGKVVAEASMSLRGSPDRAVAKMAAARPQVIFLPTFAPACPAAVRAIRATPALAGARIVVSEACQTRDALKDMGDAADGIYASGPDAGDLRADPFYDRFFIPAYRQAYGEGPPSVFHATSYDAANLLFGAIRRASVQLPGGRLLINRAEMRRTMLDVEGYKGMSGTLTCVPNGDCAQAARISVYKAPAWPQVRPGARPAFSRSFTLADVAASG